jgi:hypothetical protein
MHDKYQPRTLEELEADPTPVSLLNQPVPPDNVGVLVPNRQRSLHAVVATIWIGRNANMPDICLLFCASFGHDC